MNSPFCHAMNAAMHLNSILASNGNAATRHVEQAGAVEGKSAKGTVKRKMN